MHSLAFYLTQPNALNSLNERDWDLLLRQAQSARLHGTLAALAPNIEYPPAIARALRSATVVAQANRRAVCRELSELQKILTPIGAPLVALKGAAYVLHDFPFAYARFVTDVDILVPREKLPLIEDALRFGGFSTGKQNAYDQKYYRQWMHEIPPMTHTQRGSTLDVHHHILPLTARAKPDINALWSNIVPVGQHWHTLSAEDMVLHSMLHLFFDGEWDHALRDLWDLHQLVTQFAAHPAFWSQLYQRAQTHQLTQVLAWALPVIQHWFQTAIPDALLAMLQTQRPRFRPNHWMHRVFVAGSAPNHASVRTSADRWARRLLYLRGHYLRMPVHLLVPHLVRKSFRLEEDARTEV